LSREKTHKSKKETRYQRNLVKREVEKVEWAFANMMKISAHLGHTKPNG
jgi:hypothetical protein